MSELHGCVMPGATLTAKVYPSKRSLTENGAGMGAAGPQAAFPPFHGIPDSPLRLRVLCELMRRIVRTRLGQMMQELAGRGFSIIAEERARCGRRPPQRHCARRELAQ